FRGNPEAPDGPEASATGTFDLSADGDDNGRTCRRCVFVLEDPGAGGAVFFASEGTLTVESGSRTLEANSTLDATLTDVTFVEVEVDFEGSFETTPVPDGRCVHVESATVDVEPGPNQLTNGDFEAFSAGANPPFDPPDAWSTFGARLNPFAAVGYDNYATEVVDDSRALKTRGRALEDGDALANTLGTVFQTFTGTVPPGSTLMLSGWAYVSSAEPLDEDENAYLVVKCFDGGFAAEQCGGGAGARSALITSETPRDTWVRLSTGVEALPGAATVVQAGVEFEQCAGSPCNPDGGAVLFDDLVLTWQ
ncbi:MAG: hypothetical protein AAF602_18080, partial [Myxococcota bacterium]